jgi:PAS domain S-box-containing protein
VATDLAPAHALLVTALDHAAIGVSISVVSDGKCVVTWVNRSFTTLTGHSSSDAIGRRIEALLGEETDRPGFAALREAYERRTAYACELLCHRKDGSSFWNRIAIIPEKNAAGEYLLTTHEDISDLRRVRESLRASEARLELAMAASGLAMWDWNVERDEVYYNDQWQNVLGLDPHELVKRKGLAERLVLPSDVTVLDQFERHYRGESPRFECEYFLPGSDKPQRWVVARAKVVRRDDSGRAQRVIGVLRDVTQAHRAQEELSEVHRRWQRAVIGSSDGLYDWDLVTGHVWYAARFREILGRADGEFPDAFSSFQQAIHAEDRAAVVNAIRAHIEGGELLDVRCRLLRADRQTLWCRFRGQAERDAAGRPRRISGSISDISAEVNAEEALRYSQDFYGTILDAIPLFVAYADGEERVVYANAPFQQLFNLPLTQSKGQSMATVVGDSRYAAVQPLIQRALAGEVAEGRGRLEAASGQLLDLDGVYIPHRNDAGEVVGCLVVAHDVTQRLQLEAELRQSQKMEAVGRLTGGIAHDFNNLLSVIIGNAQLLTRSLQGTPRLVKQAETAFNAAVRGGELTRRLLAFARQQVLEPRVVEANGLIGGMWELLRRTLSRDIDLRLDLAAESWSVKVDPGQLENAVLNLVINARDALTNGGTITLRTANVSSDGRRTDTGDNVLDAGDYLQLEVADDGCGMAPEVLKRAFEPFFTTKDVGKGSGLGLAMIYGFAKQSGGHVRLASVLSKGTSVYLYFPRTRAAVESVSLEPAPHDELPRGDETILVVEDNPEVRATAIEILTSLGYQPLEAGNGPQAFERFAAHPDTDLVFSDVMLPGGILGTNLVDELRRRRAGLKVLLTSGFTDTAIMHRSLIDGTRDVLTKPYRVEELARRVRAALDRNEENKRDKA